MKANNNTEDEGKILQTVVFEMSKIRKTTEWVKIITGQGPKSFDDFVLTNKNQL